ncbi:fimbrial protein [Klebsiella sp. I138]|uniref:fimbrial protein n=1 Tax=Klebsiella sp. I138 TaxID=2755385 RepID=UPI003DA83D9B
MMRIIKWMALLFLLAPGVSQAVVCNVSRVGYDSATLSGTITVPRTVEPGDAIGGSYLLSASGTNGYVTSCSGKPPLYLVFSSTQTPSPFAGIYETNIRGVGVKVWSTFVGQGGSGNTIVGNSPVYWYSHYDSGGFLGSTAYMRVQFYATASDIGRGNISFPSPFVTARAGDQLVMYSNLSINSSLKIVPEKGCSVTNPNQTVTLLDVKTTALKNNAGRYPDGKDFNIGLSCTPETKVSMKFEGATMAGHGDVLANQSTDTDAAGNSVGIQMMYGDNPVTLGQTFLAVADATNAETLPFKAHYYYNGGANIQSGDVTSSTTFTFSYQ